MADPVLVGVGGTLLGIVITRLFDVFQWRRENRRWQAEPYRQHRADALIELHRALTACLPSYVLGDAPRPFSREEWRAHFLSRLKDAHRAAILAKPYLTRDEGIAIAQALLVFREVEKALIEFVEARSITGLDDASKAYLQLGEPYVTAYSEIVKFMEPIIVPAVVKG